MLADGAFGGIGKANEDIHHILDVYDLKEEIKKFDATDSPDLAILRKIEIWGLVAQIKAIFYTTKGRIGLAAHSNNSAAKVGDKIAILAGSKVPLVLRPVNQGKVNEYSIIY
jgi:hypothetical protein